MKKIIMIIGCLTLLTACDENIVISKQEMDYAYNNVCVCEKCGGIIKSKSAILVNNSNLNNTLFEYRCDDGTVIKRYLKHGQS